MNEIADILILHYLFLLQARCYTDEDAFLIHQHPFAKVLLTTTAALRMAEF